MRENALYTMEARDLDTKRITVKLEQETYKRLRQLALDTDQSNQAIMVKALGEYMARWDSA